MVQTNRTKASGSEAELWSVGLANKCLSKPGPQRSLLLRLWGGSTYNLRKDSFTDYVET